MMHSLHALLIASLVFVGTSAPSADYHGFIIFTSNVYMCSTQTPEGSIWRRETTTPASCATRSRQPAPTSRHASLPIPARLRPLASA